jgi:coenzyme F420 biosynthesis associated uncharacterized protein
MNAGGTLIRGLVIGTVAGVMYVASRRATAPPPRLIEWDRVRKISERVSRGDGHGAMTASPELTASYQAMVRQSELAIGAYLKESLPLPLDRVAVFDRSQWIDANVAGFQYLFEPLEGMNLGAMNGATIGTHLFGEFNQAVLSGQLGLLLGYLARKVLGQYDTALLGREPVTTGRLYFVEPNIDITQKKLGLDGGDFRTWIALHETTHAFEFEAHPWLRDYMNGQLRSYFDTLSQDFGAIAFGSGGMTGLAQRFVQNANRKGNAIEWLMTDEQKGIFDRLQALMCLLEGYSNHVMDVVGGQVLPTYPFMKKRFENRNRERSIVDQIFTKLTGLDMKLEQYVLGERFVNAQVQVMGIDRFNRIWDGPEMLPTLEEIKAPELWRARVGAMN